jgi:hypothetical protein
MNFRIMYRSVSCNISLMFILLIKTRVIIILQFSYIAHTKFIIVSNTILKWYTYFPVLCHWKGKSQYCCSYVNIGYIVFTCLYILDLSYTLNVLVFTIVKHFFFFFFFLVDCTSYFHHVILVYNDILFRFVSTFNKNYIITISGNSYMPR